MKCGKETLFVSCVACVLKYLQEDRREQAPGLQKLEAVPQNVESYTTVQYY